MKKPMIIGVILLVCNSCITPSVIVRKNVIIQRLGIYFEPGDQSIELIANQFELNLENFINRYNAKPGRKFELYNASVNDSSSLRIKLIGTRLVPPGDQAAGVAVSMLGLSLPIILISAGAPFYVGFYYFPKVKSLTELSLSGDINDSQPPTKNFVLSSPGFLMSPERQIEKHVVSFDRLLAVLIGQIERQATARKTNTYADE